MTAWSPSTRRRPPRSSGRTSSDPWQSRYSDDTVAAPPRPADPRARRLSSARVVTEKSNLAPPGWYLLFLCNEAGHSVVARWVHLESQAVVHKMVVSEKIDPTQMKKGHEHMPGFAIQAPAEAPRMTGDETL